MTGEAKSGRSNGFGALRLLFASMVIIAHTVELHDGRNHNEPLFRIFGTLTFGSLAVDGFFLISGYLIAASFISSPRTYFAKRVRRIYPGFLVCYLLCVLVVAPIAGAKLAELTPSEWIRIFYRMVMLKAPEVRGAFSGVPVATINGSMWTISYEFRCYILAAVFGALGLYKRPKLFLSLTCGMLLGCAVLQYEPFATWNSATPGVVASIVGEPFQTVRLLAIFMTGTSFMLWQPRLDGRIALIAGLLLIPALFLRAWSDVAIATLGGYVLFWCAFQIRRPVFLSLNSKDDISYGVYLYAFPLGNLILQSWPSAPVPVMGLLTWIAAAACGWASWELVEKPASAKRKSIPAAPGWREQASELEH